jgi:hypothetical protein
MARGQVYRNTNGNIITNEDAALPPINRHGRQYAYNEFNAKSNPINNAEPVAFKPSVAIKPKHHMSSDIFGINPEKEMKEMKEIQKVQRNPSNQRRQEEFMAISQPKYDENSQSTINLSSNNLSANMLANNMQRIQSQSNLFDTSAFQRNLGSPPVHSNFPTLNDSSYQSSQVDSQIQDLQAQVQIQQESLKSMEKWLEEVSLLARRDDQILRNDIQQLLQASFSSMKDQFLTNLLKQSETSIHQISEQQRSMIDLVAKQLQDTVQRFGNFDERLGSLENNHERDLHKVMEMMQGVKSDQESKWNHIETTGKLEKIEYVQQLEKITQQYVQQEMARILQERKPAEEMQLEQTLKEYNKQFSAKLESEITNFITKQLPMQIEQFIDKVLKGSDTTGKIDFIRQRQDELERKVVQSISSVPSILDSMSKENAKKAEQLQNLISDQRKEMMSQCTAMVHDLRKEMYKIHSTVMTPAVEPTDKYSPRKNSYQ